MPTFHEANMLVPVRLGPAAPLGYLRSLDPNSNATEFLVVEHGVGKAAIILSAVDPRWIFEFIPLDDDNTAWGGVSLGAAEVLVDLTSGELSDQPRFQRGAITVSAGRIFLSAMPSGRLGSRVAFDMGHAADAAGTASAMFLRWQLVQRDREGKPVVLFDAGQHLDRPAI